MGEPHEALGYEAELHADHDLRHAYATEYQHLVGLARLLVDQREDAEEVVQEAFARTWVRLGRVEGDVIPYLRHAVVTQSRQPRRAGRSLPRRQRECAVLRYYVDLPIAEIARSLGVAEGTVTSHLHRAVETTSEAELRDQLHHEAGHIAAPHPPDWERVVARGHRRRRATRIRAGLAAAALAALSIVGVVVAGDLAGDDASKDDAPTKPVSGTTEHPSPEVGRTTVP